MFAICRMVFILWPPLLCSFVMLMQPYKVHGKFFSKHLHKVDWSAVHGSIAVNLMRSYHWSKPESISRGISVDARGCPIQIIPCSQIDQLKVWLCKKTVSQPTDYCVLWALCTLSSALRALFTLSSCTLSSLHSDLSALWAFYTLRICTPSSLYSEFLYSELFVLWTLCTLSFSLLWALCTLSSRCSEILSYLYSELSVLRAQSSQ